MTASDHPLDHCWYAVATAVAITPWWYSEISETWHEGTALTLNAASGFRAATAEGAGEARVYLQIDSVTGGGDATIWGGYSYGEPGRDG